MDGPLSDKGRMPARRGPARSCQKSPLNKQAMIKSEQVKVSNQCQARYTVGHRVCWQCGSRQDRGWPEGNNSETTQIKGGRKQALVCPNMQL